LDHPILSRIRRDGFEPLGWFMPNAEDGFDPTVQFVILIGNAGPAMFRRFARMRDHRTSSMDDWTHDVVDALAKDLDAKAIYPFDTPPRPFLTWARRGSAGFTSPLGLNIHPRFGLWHAYRAALLFPVAFDMPRPATRTHPCDICVDKPCLNACPVSAFDGKNYDVKSCGQHVLSPQGSACMAQSCLARRACPVGQDFTYEPAQLNFHMRAFAVARQKEL
jgi:epoxyqueuosine reductase QueG